MPSIEINSIAGKLIGNGACRGCVPNRERERERERDCFARELTYRSRRSCNFRITRDRSPGSAKISFRDWDVVVEVLSRPRNPLPLPLELDFFATHRRVNVRIYYALTTLRWLEYTGEKKGKVSEHGKEICELLFERLCEKEVYSCLFLSLIDINISILQIHCANLITEAC